MNGETDGVRPRAYYPDGTDTAPGRKHTPGWDMGPERKIDDGRSLARALGWFSIGLGLFELAAPGQLTRFLGVDESNTNLVRLYGAREVGHGVAILSERTPSAAVWSRVGGDALDLATLGLTLARGRPRRDRIFMAMAAVAGVAVLDGIAAQQLSRRESANGSRRAA